MAKLDLPEPDTPERTTNLFLGISTVISLRLCSRAPVTMMELFCLVSTTDNFNSKFKPKQYSNYQSLLGSDKKYSKSQSAKADELQNLRPKDYINLFRISLDLPSVCPIADFIMV